MENVDKTQEERDPVSAAESFSREKPAAPAADAAAAPSLKVEAGDGKTAPSIHLEEDASDALKTEAGGGNGLPPGGTAGSLTAVPEPEPKPERSNLPAELPKSSQQTPHPKGTLAQLWDLFWDTFQNRYWKFSGRANRTEFWTFFPWWTLCELDPECSGFSAFYRFLRGPCLNRLVDRDARSDLDRCFPAAS